MCALNVRIASVLCALCSFAVIAPLWAQSPVISQVSIGPSPEEVGAGDPFPSPYFGETVAIDDRTVMASMPGDTAVDPNTFGRVAVFRKTEQGWQRTATIVGTEESGGGFGQSMDIDGNRAVIAGWKAIYLFERCSTGWVQVAKVVLTSADKIVGRQVQLDGNLIAARIFEEEAGVVIKSAVRIYAAKRRGALTHTATLRPTDGSAVTTFGASLALQGHLLVIGASADASAPGAAYVFGRFGDRWISLDRLAASDGTDGDGFGTSVALRRGIIAVGAPGADLGIEDEFGRLRGNVYVFLPHRRGWYESQRLNEPSNPNPTRNIGSDVTLGKRLLAVIARDDRGMIRDEQYVYVYDWEAGRFQFGQQVVRYEGRVPDIDMSARTLIASTHVTPVFIYYVLGAARILTFGHDTPASEE